MEMAVACVKPNMTMDEEDEDAPVVFKRRDTSSKHTNQPNSESRAFVRPDKQPGKLTPDRNQSSSGLKSPIRSDKQPGKPVQDGRTVVSKGKVVQSSKPSSSNAAVAIKKSPPPSAKASPSSSSRASPVKSPSLNGGSSVGQPPRKDNRLSAVKEEKRSVSDSEDSEDDKPISVRLSAGLQKSNSKVDERDDKLSASDSEGSDDDKPLSARLSSAVSKGNSTSKERASSFGSLHSIKPKVDDSDDEKPLSSKFSRNSSTGASCSKSYEAKPLASKVQLNGSIKRENIIKTSSMSNKRPSSENSSGQSSLKKAKVVDTPPAAKAKQVSMKAETKDEDDHIPIAQRMKKATPDSKSVTIKKKDKKVDSSSLKKVNQKSKKMMKKSMYSKSYKVPPGSGEGQKWTTLVHNGVIFPPPYKPHGVKMLYDGKPIVLTPEQEEVATMYAVMLETDYIQKPKFNENFFSDWKKLLGKNHVIQDLKKCDFTPIYQWHLAEKEKKKQMSSEEKKALREEKLKQEEKYMWAIVDGVKEKVGNFRVEPPGLFRGRGEHPKMGKLKKRIYPSDITINIGKDATVPECPIPGQRWKEVRHDNTVTWLAYWNDPINPKEFKYVFLAASSSLKGQSDKEKYEKSRKLKDYIQGIRKAYTRDFTSKDMAKQQIAVATYLIDRLALRAGNEKDDDEADTVGCCTLKVENVKPIPPNILEFDFLGKDSIKYYKQFEPEPLVFKAIERFRKGKQPSDDLFDRLDTSKLNAHLKELMPGLTAKVFRTFNASFTLDDMLSQGAGGGEVPQKLDVYREANKEVAIICNHQRTVSKSHTAQMERLTQKINAAKELLSELEIDLARAKKGKPPLKDSSGKQKRNLTPEALEKKIVKTKGDIQKLERDMQTKEDLKEIALGTSKINYLDPRITVAWCKRNEVPIEKIFNKSLLAKFAWAMDAPPHFKF